MHGYTTYASLNVFATLPETINKLEKEYGVPVLWLPVLDLDNAATILLKRDTPDSISLPIQIEQNIKERIDRFYAPNLGVVLPIRPNKV